MAKYVFGVDIGGTTVKIGLFTAEGTMIDNFQLAYDDKYDIVKVENENFCIGKLSDTLTVDD